MQREYRIGQKGLSVVISDVNGRLQVKSGKHSPPVEIIT